MVNSSFTASFRFALVMRSFSVSFRGSPDLARISLQLETADHLGSKTALCEAVRNVLFCVCCSPLAITDLENMFEGSSGASWIPNS